MTDHSVPEAQHGLVDRASLARWGSPIRAIGSLARLWWERLQGRRALLHAFAEDYRMLDDLRIGRSDLLSEADKPFWRG